MNPVVLVTGAGRGIGAAIARRQAAAGWAVTATARTESAVCETATHIRDRGGQAIGVAADAADPDRMTEAVDATVEEFGHLDAVVCAAGRSPDERWIDHSVITEWRDCIEANLLGVVATLNAVVPELHRAGSGSILILGSGAADRCPPGHAAYAASKAAVHAVVRTAARELVTERIAVNELRPGPTHTELLTHGRRAGAPSGLLNAVSSTFGNEWIKTPDQVADLAATVLELPPFGTTGQTFTFNRLE